MVRSLTREEREIACDLVWEVFMEFEAPLYGAEGVETFRKTALEDEAYLDALTWYGAWQGDELAGVIATRREGSHIALFFVKGAYQGRGIGSALFRAVLAKSKAASITVHASPVAQAVYRHLGFSETDQEQCEQGIRFIPMVYTRDGEQIPACMARLLGCDITDGYHALQELEQISDATGLLYGDTEFFATMIADEKSVMRVRGFRLFCKQAKWDVDQKMAALLEGALTILHDEKPTVVRQALASLREVVTYQPHLRAAVAAAVSAIPYLEYRDTMHRLMAADMEELLHLCTD